MTTTATPYVSGTILVTPLFYPLFLHPVENIAATIGLVGRFQNQWLQRNAAAIGMIVLLAPATAGSLFLFERHKNPLEQPPPAEGVSTGTAETGHAVLGPVEAGVISPQDSAAELGMTVPEDTWALFVWLPVEVTGESFNCPVQRLHEPGTGRIFQPAVTQLGWSSTLDSWCSGADTTLETIFLIPEDVEGVFHLEIGEADPDERAHLLVDVSSDDSQ